MFSELKISQMSAYLLSLGHGKMAYLKLMKLLYLSERQSMARWGESMSGDDFVSMKRGPVLSNTYDLLKTGGRDSQGWSDYIKGVADYEVALVKSKLTRDDLDELSDAELKIMEEIFNEFGMLTQWQLVDYTHDHCPEWSDPGSSSKKICTEDLLKSVCKPEQFKALLSLHKEMKGLDRARFIIQ